MKIIQRTRRLRSSAWIRNLVREQALSPSDLIWPLFVRGGDNEREPIKMMPGVHRFSIDLIVKEAKKARDLGIPMIALFPYTNPELRSDDAKEALNPDNLVNLATKAIKDAVPEIGVMLDVALDPYSSHGHDGIMRDDAIDNDLTIAMLVKQSLVQAASGADVLGPSDMMDGRIGAIREALEEEGHKNTAIMAYSAKFASAYYGPFREAVGASGVLKGDKKTYQLDPANGDMALELIARDINEGADMVMVKPGLAYLDVCARASDTFNTPLFAYQVSGEYTMLKNAVDQGIFEESAISESLLAFKRAGCTGVLTYFAPLIAEAFQS